MDDLREENIRNLINGRNPPVKTNSRTSILSRKSSGKSSPRDHHNEYSLDIQATSSDNLSLSSRLSGLEINPMFDSNKRRKSSNRTLHNYLSNSNNSLESSPKRQIRNFVVYPMSGSNSS